MSQLIAWIMSLGTLAAVLFWPHNAYKGHLPTLIESSVYQSSSRVAWALAFGWIVFACATNRGGPLNTFLSWTAFEPLSNLCYLAYLSHPLLINYHTGRLRERIYYGHYELMSIFLARVVLTFLLSYILYVFVESPFASVEKYIFRKKKAEGESSVKK